MESFPISALGRAGSGASRAESVCLSIHPSIPSIPSIARASQPRVPLRRHRHRHMHAASSSSSHRLPHHLHPPVWALVRGRVVCGGRGGVDRPTRRLPAPVLAPASVGKVLLGTKKPLRTGGKGGGGLRFMVRRLARVRGFPFLLEGKGVVEFEGGLWNTCRNIRVCRRVQPRRFEHCFLSSGTRLCGDDLLA